MRSKSSKFLFVVLLFTAILQEVDALALTKETLDPKSKHILVISSYNDGYTWSDDIIDHIGSHLMTNHNHFDVSVEHISSEYNPDFTVWVYRYNIILSAYKSHPPDILVLIGDEAWFAHRYSMKREEFKKTQVIVVAAKNLSFSMEQLSKVDSLEFADLQPTVELFDDLNATGALRKLNIEGVFDVAGDMVKPLKNIYILTDFRIQGYYSKLLAKDIIKKRGHPNGIFISSNDINTDSLLHMVPSFRDSSAIFISSWFTTGFGFRYSVNYTYSQISKSSKLPVFGIVGQAVEDGFFTGGFFMPEDFWGEQAVKLIDQVDQIGSARLIEPVIYLDSVFHLNWKNARERSIKRSSILKQSVIYSRPLDFLRKYKEEIIIIGTIFIILLISAILVFRSYLQVRASKSRLMDSEDNLFKALRKSQESDRLKSAFLANMSHEIRTPLNSILGFSELLSETTDEDERRQYIKIISSSSDLLLRLIDDILDLSKIEAGTYEFVFERVDLCELIEELRQIFQHKEREDLKIIVDCKYSQLEIFADRKRLFQVLTNLVNNAMKFTAKGYVRVSCHIEEFEDERIVVIEVEDTGMGIPPDKVASIFDRFVKLNDLSEGTGLGLTISNTIIKKHKGTIQVESRYGYGSKFTIRLPV
ncbi:MAG: HAMP domain-containing sensor histidine kinase [Bacteroidales bacterium]